MKVKNTELCELLFALGVDTAPSWGATKTENRVNTTTGFARFVPKDQSQLVLTDEQRALLKKVLAAQSRSEPLTIEDDGRVPIRDRSKFRPRKIVRPPRVVYPPGFREWPEKRKLKYWSKHPRQLPIGGVTAVVVRELVKAGQSRQPRPVTKEYLLRILKEHFPERDDQKMMTNLNNLVPSRCRDVYGLRIERVPQPGGVLGYYAISAADDEGK